MSRVSWKRVATGFVVAAGLLLGSRAVRPQEAAFERLTLAVDSVLVNNQLLVSLAGYEDFTVSIVTETVGIARFRASNGAQTFEVVYTVRRPTDGGPTQ